MLPITDKSIEDKGSLMRTMIVILIMKNVPDIILCI